MGMGPLNDLKVIDLTSVIMGPMATSILGDFGADVIKVESPLGDVNRTMGQPLGHDQSELSLNLNRNKRAVTLNLKDEDDRYRLLELVTDADLVVTNLRPKVRRKLAIDYDDLKQVNESLIYCAMHGYNSESEFADDPAYDDIVQGQSGLAGLSSHVDGSPKFAPYLAGDKIAALYATIGILSAVRHLNRTGHGSYVEVPMVDVLTSFNLVENLAGQTVPEQPGEFGWSRTLTAKRALYKANDGWVTVLPYSDKNWRDFFELIAQPYLAINPRYSSLTVRTKHMDELIDLVAPHIAAHPVSYWISQCRARDIPVTEVMDPESLIDDRYVWESGIISHSTHPDIGSYRRLSTPIRFDGSIPQNDRLQAPALNPANHSDQSGAESPTAATI